MTDQLNQNHAPLLRQTRIPLNCIKHPAHKTQTKSKGFLHHQFKALVRRDAAVLSIKNQLKTN